MVNQNPEFLSAVLPQRLYKWSCLIVRVDVQHPIAYQYMLGVDNQTD